MHLPELRFHGGAAAPRAERVPDELVDVPEALEHRRLVAAELPEERAAEMGRRGDEHELTNQPQRGDNDELTEQPDRQRWVLVRLGFDFQQVSYQVATHL